MVALMALMAPILSKKVLEASTIVVLGQVALL